MRFIVTLTTKVMLDSALQSRNLLLLDPGCQRFLVWSRLYEFLDKISSGNNNVFSLGVDKREF
jgi:hypothetical protein